MRLPNHVTKFGLIVHNAAEKGILLLLAALIAVLMANSELSGAYHHFLHENLSISLGQSTLSLTVHHWINDLLMAIFFLVVGSEIKREMVIGHLSTKSQRVLPLAAAAAGVIVPLIIYVACNYNSVDANSMRGWAIPTATDIAFALGMLALFGKGLPASLRIFLTALAIIDDLIAIVIIAIFYTDTIHLSNFIYILGCIIFLNTLRKAKYDSLSLYFLVGAVMWYLFLDSGVHASISGVVLGFCIPLEGKNKTRPLKNLEHALYPMVYYFILPLFAFANSGVIVKGMTLAQAFNPISLGIILGLFIGKQIGIFGTVYVMYKTKMTQLPEKSNLLQFYGVSILCGIGFTMSLLISSLGYEELPQHFNNAQLGVLVGSLISSVFGAFIIHLSRNKK